MVFLYVTEQGAKISVEANYVKVQKGEIESRLLPIETLESISIFGNVQMTTQCMKECLKKVCFRQG